MKTKNLIYIGIIMVVLVGSLFAGFGRMGGNAVKESKSDVELSKYRSEEIPEECKLPENQDLEWWKEHLSHHKETLYCLDYYE